MLVGTVAFLDQKQPHSGSGPSLLSLLQQVQASWHHSPHTDHLQTIQQIVLAEITFLYHFHLSQYQRYLPDYHDNSFMHIKQTNNIKGSEII